MEIRTERLVLRRPRLADLDAVVAACAGFVRIGTGEHAPPFRDGTTVGVHFELR